MEIKRGSSPVISLRFKGLGPETSAEAAEFVFKQECREDAPVLLRKKWPGQVTRGVDGAFRVPLSEAETRLFQEGRHMYLEGRIFLTGGSIAVTPVTVLMVRQTLFEEGVS